MVFFIAVSAVLAVSAFVYTCVRLAMDVEEDNLQSLAEKESIMCDDSGINMEPGYVYRAHIISVYDGDTVRANIDLGFNIFMNDQVLRLCGIDTPEVSGEEREQGLKIRDYVRDLILDKDVIIKTYKDSKGKYGRWLADIYYYTKSGQVNLNEELVKKGLAELYE